MKAKDFLTLLKANPEAELVIETGDHELRTVTMHGSEALKDKNGNMMLYYDDGSTPESKYGKKIDVIVIQ